MTAAADVFKQTNGYADRKAGLAIEEEGYLEIINGDYVSIDN